MKNWKKRKFIYQFLFLPFPIFPHFPLFPYITPLFICFIFHLILSPYQESVLKTQNPRETYLFPSLEPNPSVLLHLPRLAPQLFQHLFHLATRSFHGTILSRCDTLSSLRITQQLRKFMSPSMITLYSLSMRRIIYWSVMCVIGSLKRLRDSIHQIPIYSTFYQHYSHSC